MSAKRMTLTRRRLVGGTVGLLGLTAFGRWLLGGRPGVEILVGELVRQVAVPDPVAAGIAYLRAAPADADADALAGRVLAGLPLAGTAAEVRHAFRQRLAADFREGLTVQADGWFLSQTEARLCALVALETGAVAVRPAVSSAPRQRRSEEEPTPPAAAA